MSDTYDLIVIGGGPAGYAAAIRAGQLKKRVLCIEAERAGGTCLNWGCIPTKALLKSAELYESFFKAESFGLGAENFAYNFGKIIERSRSIADKMGSGIEYLFKKHSVDYVIGKARALARGKVEVLEGKKAGTVYSADKILLATGCKARSLPGLTVDGKRIMTSREALAMQKQPKSIIILGAGAIGVEFAYFLNTLGTKVTLIEMLGAIVPNEDHDISKALERSFTKRGIMCYTGTKAQSVQILPGDTGVSVTLEDLNGATQKKEAECLLLSIGLIPNTKNLWSDALSIKTEKGYICVNDAYETTESGIFAAGDVIGAPWLAHVATYEALQAVNGMFAGVHPKRVNNFPACTYCQPQIASIGLTEQALQAEKREYLVGKFPFTASGKAVASGQTEGFVKVLTDKQYGEILGAHILGAEATELIAEYALAMGLEATAEDVHHTIHAHPTLSEGLAEAAADSEGLAIHI